MQKSGKGVTLKKERCGSIDEDEKVEAKGLQLEHTFMLNLCEFLQLWHFSSLHNILAYSVYTYIYIHIYKYIGLCIIILLWYNNNIIRGREEDLYMIYNLSIIL